MRIETHRFTDLNDLIVDRWRHWIAADPSFQSAFLHPEFCRAVHAVSSNVEVAVAFEENDPIAVLPFQRISKRSAGPVGGFLSDRHGWVSKPGKRLNLSSFLELTDISSFRFHMLPADEIPEVRCMAIRRTVVFADLSMGFNAYNQRRKQLGSNVVSKLAQKERKISNEVGPLQLVEGFTEDGFQSLLRWKQVACDNRRVKNVLATRCAQATLRHFFESESDDFRPQFLRLMAGDHLVAVHLGLICHQRVAAWFPAFNPHYARYSPGLLILLQLLRKCESWGITRVDFGNGEMGFKERFMTDESTMLEGIVDQNLFNAIFHCGWLKTRDWAKSSQLQPLLQRVWHYCRTRSSD